MFVRHFCNVVTKRERNFWQFFDNRKQFLADIEVKLGIKNPEEWYEVEYSKVSKLGGSGLLNHFDNSVAKAVVEICPHYNLQLWKFKHNQLPALFWKERENVLSYLEDLGKKLNIKELEDWYAVRIKQVEENKGNKLLKSFGDSFQKVLKFAYPEYEWLEWRFGRVPSAFWEDEKNQKRFVEYIAKKYNVKKERDWYSIMSSNFTENGGKTLLSLYENSHIKLLQKVYPTYDWKIWKFKYVPSGFWQDKENHKTFFEEIAKELNIKHFSEWYLVSVEDVFEIGGTSLLTNYYGGSLCKALISLYPEHNWEVWKFSYTSQGFWKNIENQRSFLISLEKKFEMKNLEGWYRVSRNDIIENGGAPLLNLYDDSIIKLITTFYPNQKWQIWRFERVPDGFWDNDKNVKEVLDWLAENFRINTLDDWYEITVSLGCSRLLDKSGGLLAMLKKFYPEHKWDESLRKVFPSKMQAFLVKQAQEIFPFSMNSNKS